MENYFVRMLCILGKVSLLLYRRYIDMFTLLPQCFFVHGLPIAPNYVQVGLSEADSGRQRQTIRSNYRALRLYLTSAISCTPMQQIQPVE